MPAPALDKSVVGAPCVALRPREEVGEEGRPVAGRPPTGSKQHLEGV